ncbi:MAG: 3-hydroxyacyl-ACP dehydratase FabZ [Betaproteobacteria bacterium]|uniref:3-hydroxyacyl-ACP dehydratase FabZ n=1 Tax=Thiomonas sp. FB-6 TaxID=1158291 RepID=UPI0004779622|nr:3-hydroxyacyl-ACP dehydratase FabZ [Thiomonas sp. FB-6]MBU6439769.1 3-hydroxyacyl-ACP dehydratase FabZ [Betaproteobacteria bacterium]MBU6512693.1 3-hydroxyacyl-ACP dehydratase FabZ [Betaproteobacteria bacterium]MDE1955522.1 3-hydroxyacyl-ACP dehydratase FabZ [Betaproteobacteria bacterium]MDE2152502.1 3-hydroxyacyl-ACP dehydratase FabZ [Betaproteobacteria bacterium]MDE2478060.1 3-hydroxyacyl-ACP dehydratase FabZ [Betaproteobacteria bacterium]
MFDINQIQKLLPHRYPFLLVDRVVEFVKGERIVAYKNVSFNEPYFTGHFPQKPIMPGVLILEALAQAAGILAFGTLDVQAEDDSVYYLVGVDGARFKRPVEPGDQLMLDVRLTRHMRNIYKFQAVARVGEEMAAEAELMCTERVID